MKYQFDEGEKTNCTHRLKLIVATLMTDLTIGDIPFFGRWVGFQKSDITMLKQPLHWVKIGDGWVGRSKNGLKNRLSFVDGPLFLLYFNI